MCLESVCDNACVLCAQSVWVCLCACLREHSIDPGDPSVYVNETVGTMELWVVGDRWELRTQRQGQGEAEKQGRWCNARGQKWLRAQCNHDYSQHNLGFKLKVKLKAHSMFHVFQPSLFSSHLYQMCDYHWQGCHYDFWVTWQISTMGPKTPLPNYLILLQQL